MYVNGQRYGSDNAAIAVGNSPAADEAQLRVGMVVTVAASPLTTLKSMIG